MSQLQRVTKEQSVKLKEAGFDWETNRFVKLYENGMISDVLIGTYYNYNHFETMMSIPELDLACKWLRQTKKAIIFAFPIDDWEHYGFRVFYPDLSAPFYEVETELKDYPTYEAAQSAGLDVALDFNK